MEAAREEAHRRACEEEAACRRAGEEEEEARHRALEEEAQRRAQAEEAEARRKALEEEARRRAQEEEAKRQALAEEARRLALQEEARRRAVEEEARRRALDEEARWKANEERRTAALEEAARMAREQEQARKRHPPMEWLGQCFLDRVAFQGSLGAEPPDALSTPSASHWLQQAASPPVADMGDSFFASAREWLPPSRALDGEWWDTCGIIGAVRNSVLHWAHPVDGIENTKLHLDGSRVQMQFLGEDMDGILEPDASKLRWSTGDRWWRRARA